MNTHLLIVNSIHKLILHVTISHSITDYSYRELRVTFITYARDAQDAQDEACFKTFQPKKVF